MKINKLSKTKILINILIVFFIFVGKVDASNNSLEQNNDRVILRSIITPELNVSSLQYFKIGNTNYPREATFKILGTIVYQKNGTQISIMNHNLYTKTVTSNFYYFNSKIMSVDLVDSTSTKLKIKLRITYTYPNNSNTTDVYYYVNV